MIGGVINSEDFEGKRVSLRLMLFILALVAFAVYEGSYIYFRFERLEARFEKQAELHSQDVEHIKEQMQYERERIDRKFKRIE